jgi:anti-sigma B factor antagonist
MFKIDYSDDGKVRVAGRLDAAQAASAQAFLDAVEVPCVIDMGALEYISSAGLGVLLRTHKRLMAKGQGIRLVNVSRQTADIFRYSGFDKLFAIEVQA